MYHINFFFCLGKVINHKIKYIVFCSRKLGYQTSDLWLNVDKTSGNHAKTFIKNHYDALSTSIILPMNQNRILNSNDLSYTHFAPTHKPQTIKTENITGNRVMGIVW